MVSSGPLSFSMPDGRSPEAWFNLVLDQLASSNPLWDRVMEEYAKYIEFKTLPSEDLQSLVAGNEFISIPRHRGAPYTPPPKNTGPARLA